MAAIIAVSAAFMVSVVTAISMNAAALMPVLPATFAVMTAAFMTVAAASMTRLTALAAVIGASFTVIETRFAPVRAALSGARVVRVRGDGPRRGLGGGGEAQPGPGDEARDQNDGGEITQAHRAGLPVRSAGRAPGQMSQT
jgi:uncharacterized membrane protein YgcG